MHVIKFPFAFCIFTWTGLDYQTLTYIEKVQHNYVNPEYACSQLNRMERLQQQQQQPNR
jgi:hypothetical protein